MSIGRRSLSLSGEVSQSVVRLFAYLVISIVLMTLDQRGQYLTQFHALTRQASEPVIMAIGAPLVWARQLKQWQQDRRELIHEQDQLQRQLAVERARGLQVARLGAENTELRSLLGLSQEASIHYTTAQVISVDLNPFSHRVLIDVGSHQGLAPALAVVDQSGLIGQVDTVAASTASVILITDPDHALPVRVERTGEVTLAYGGGLEADLRLTDLPMNADLVAGDRLVTSGLGGVFPPGLPVATVIEIERPPDQTFARATARPSAQLDRSRFVVVLQANPPPASSAEDPLVPDEGIESVEVTDG